MLVLLWNCRGLNQEPIDEPIQSLVGNGRSDIIFLMETKMRYGNMQHLRERLRFWGDTAVAAVGSAGGMCIWWRRGIKLGI